MLPFFHFHVLLPFFYGCITTIIIYHHQLRAIAEAAMRELQAKVQEREGQIAALTAKLQEHQAAYLEQHARDRAEIEALSNKLFESGAASIAGQPAACTSTALDQSLQHHA